MEPLNYTITIKLRNWLTIVRTVLFESGTTGAKRERGAAEYFFRVNFLRNTNESLTMNLSGCADNIRGNGTRKCCFIVTNLREIRRKLYTKERIISTSHCHRGRLIRNEPHGIDVSRFMQTSTHYLYSD